MSSTIGKQLELAVFGESHGAAIGCVINGLPAGEPLDEEQILAQMARRAPGTDKTRRKLCPAFSTGAPQAHRWL